MITLAPLRNRAFVAGLISGVVALLLGRLIINATSMADWLVAPLLVNDSSARADAIVVLGGGVIGDCVPNLNSMRRTVLAARLFRDGRAPILLITGGTSDGSCPVADAMVRFARELGVPDEKMIVERQSRNTWENAERSAPLLRREHVARVLLVTDRLHMRRAAGVFAKQGFGVEPVAVPIYEGQRDNVDMLWAGFREAVALGHYRMRGRIDSTPMTKMADHEPAGRAAGQRGWTDQRKLSNPAGPLVILGASYAGNWGIDEAGGARIVNAGVAGQQSAELLARFDRDVVSVQPRAVLLWGFINDLFAADDLEKSSARVRDIYSQMIVMAREKGIEPILATEITVRPRDGWMDRTQSTVGWMLGKVSYQDRINQRVSALNQWIREIGPREGLLVLDFQGTLADADGRRRREYATDDGSHVTAEGYEALTQYVRPILARHFGATGGRTSDRP